MASRCTKLVLVNGGTASSTLSPVLISRGLTAQPSHETLCWNRKLTGRRMLCCADGMSLSSVMATFEMSRSISNFPLLLDSRTPTQRRANPISASISFRDSLRSELDPSRGSRYYFVLSNRRASPYDESNSHVDQSAFTLARFCGWSVLIGCCLENLAKFLGFRVSGPWAGRCSVLRRSAH